jgi:hypothetical protein
VDEQPVARTFRDSTLNVADDAKDISAALTKIETVDFAGAAKA